MKPDKERTKAILDNWRRWSMVYERDSAEIPYYTVCPDFAGIVKRTSSNITFDEESAWMVELVMREVYMVSRGAWNLIRKYYLRPHEDTAEVIADEIGIHRATLFRRLDRSRDIFAEEWALIVNGS
jgi:hypothetical protein